MQADEARKMHKDGKLRGRLVRYTLTIEGQQDGVTMSVASSTSPAATGRYTVLSATPTGQFVRLENVAGWVPTSRVTLL